MSTHLSIESMVIPYNVLSTTYQRLFKMSYQRPINVLSTRDYTFDVRIDLITDFPVDPVDVGSTDRGVATGKKLGYRTKKRIVTRQDDCYRCGLRCRAWPADVALGELVIFRSSFKLSET